MNGSLIREFHADHRQVVSALVKLRLAISESHVGQVRSVLDSAEGLLGPHFKFEEQHLYPALEPFLGSQGVKRLVGEHDGVFRNVGNIAQLARKDQWSETDCRSAQESLELIYEHPISCDGLSLWIERLPSEQRHHLSSKMEEVRRQGTTFSDYARERRAA